VFSGAVGNVVTLLTGKLGSTCPVDVDCSFTLQIVWIHLLSMRSKLMMRWI